MKNHRKDIILVIALTFLLTALLYIFNKDVNILGIPDENDNVEQTTCERILAQNETKQKFALDIPVQKYSGIIPQIVFNKEQWDKASMYKTVIRDGAKQGVNYAGHFIVTEWGCGTGCQMHSVADAKTGLLADVGLQSEFGASYNPENRVLILNPKENMPTFAQSDMKKEDYLSYANQYKREFYVIQEGTGPRASIQKICTENGGEGLDV